MVTTVQ